MYTQKNNMPMYVFHTYMQGSIKYFILTDAVSFIPSNISGRCRIVGIPHPAGHVHPFKRETAYGVRFAELLKSPPAPNLIREELYDWCIKGLVIDQRHTGFREELTHLGRAFQALGWSALPCTVTGGERRIDRLAQDIAAHFKTEHDGNAAVSVGAF
jgi:hypothetical protein